MEQLNHVNPHASPYQDFQESIAFPLSVNNITFRIASVLKKMRFYYGKRRTGKDQNEKL